MRKIIIPLLLLIASIESADSQWKKIYTFHDRYGVPEHISSIYFLDLPGPPKIGFVGTVSELWKTTDGGQSWNVVWPQPPSASVFVADICFKDSLTGWFAYDGFFQGIYRTNDGGENWYLLPNSTWHSGVDGLYFNKTNQRLIASGSDTGIMVSIDLGATWNQIKTTGTGGISFFSDTIGIVTTFTDTSTSFLHSIDGGITWSGTSWYEKSGAIIQPLAIPGTSTSFGSSLGAIKVYRSDDYGATWRLVHDFGPFQDSQFNRIGRYGTGTVYGNLSRLYIQTDTGMYISTDSGQSWVFDGGPPIFSSTENHRFYSSKGVTFAALDTGSAGLGYDGSLWQEIWPQSGLKNFAINPNSISLESYPNPATSRTTFSYTLPEPGAAMLTIVDAAGRETPLIRSAWQSAGAHEATWDASAYPSGVYLLRLVADGEVVTKRVVVMR